VQTLMADKKWSELWKGEYNASTQYEVSDTVSYNGSTYTCILYPPVGTAPTNTTYWRLVAQKGNTGDQGPQGPQGVKGDKGDKGDKGLNWRGTWSNSTAYSVDDAVYYNGSSYVCIQANTGQTPTNTSYWELIAQKGDTGAQGPQGPQGVQGPQGPQGDAGVSAGLLYAFNTDTTDSDPGNGQLKFNNATISSVTQIFTDNLENGGGDVSSFIDTWDDSTDPNVKGIIKITKRGAENNFAVFNITGSVVNGTGYRKVTVSHVSSSGSFSASDILSVLFSRTGNKGTDGTGAGDVIGPSSAINNNFAAFDGTTGKLIKDSGSSSSSFEPAGAVSTHASSTSTHGVSGNLVGTTDTQTLTNKTLTSPKIGTAILDTNGNEIIETPATASAVNQVKIINAATGENPSIEASGDDIYIPLLLKGKSASPRVGGTYDNGNLTGAVTIDCKKGTRQKGTLTGNVTITISNPSEGEALELFLLQDATGGRTISFSTTIIWQDNVTPTFTTTASKMNSIVLRYVGSTWYGVGAKFA